MRVERAWFATCEATAGEALAISKNREYCLKRYAYGDAFLTKPSLLGFGFSDLPPTPYSTPNPHSGAQQHEKGEEMVNKGTILKNLDTDII